MVSGNSLLEKRKNKTKLSTAKCCASCEYPMAVDGKLQCPFYCLDEGEVFVSPWIVCEKYKRHSKFSEQVRIDEMR